jgi:hypothetical protein
LKTVNGGATNAIASRRRSLFWLIGWAALICALYVPTLAMNFDFNDDGSLVYPAPPMPAAQRVELYWSKVIADYKDRGPFCPVLWAHWEVEAQTLGAHPMRWRALRLIWAVASAALMLAVLLEIGARPEAAIFAVAVAMWAPDRDEIWTSLTIDEGVVMPYAMLVLYCALRGARSKRPLGWDIGGALCMIAILLSKNTFAAMIPAQLMLRVWPDGRDWRAGWRMRGKRAIPLALPALIPIIHFAVFKAAWHSGQYRVSAPSLGELGVMSRVIWNAGGVIYLAAGLALSVIAMSKSEEGKMSARGMLVAMRPVWERHRAAIISGSLLLFAGTMIFLPVSGSGAGRYSVPAVWGIDFWFAAFVSELIVVGDSVWKRAAVAAFVAGLAAIAFVNLMRQGKFGARIQCLWQMIDVIEQRAPLDACVGWVVGPKLDLAEGIHFAWHLRGRGHPEQMVFIGQPELSSSPQGVTLGLEPALRCVEPEFAISATPSPPVTGLVLARHVSVPYRFGLKYFDCYEWERIKTQGAGPQK